MPTVLAGHRGAAGLAPENTLESFELSVRLGTPWVELDVQPTRDGKIVCFHDGALDRVTPLSGPVVEREASELTQTLVLPGAFAGAYPSARIPLLSEALRIGAPNTRFFVELKSIPDGKTPFVRRVLDVVDDAGMSDQVRYISFDVEILRSLASQCPPRSGRSPIGILTSVREADRLLPLAHELRAEAIHAPFRVVTPELVASAHESGIEIAVWTVNEAVDFRRMADLGVDQVTTDYPDRVAH